jgi:[CysO sulfur-carrier protein]-S-L-cysteine hydrolase
MFTLDKDSYDQLVAHAESEWPNEACALLAGHGPADGDGGGWTVTKVFVVPNAEPSPSFYFIDAKAQLAAMNEMDDNDWDLVGIFHSHTFTEAYPSKTDVKLAEPYPDPAYLILSLADRDAPELRAFSVRDGQVSEVKVEVGP